MTRTAHTKTRCTAHTKRGMPCAAWAIKGGRVCIRHGAAAGQVKAAAERRLVALEQERAARKAVKRLGLAEGEPVPDLDPRDVLSEELWRSVKVVRGLSAEVAELGEIHAEGKPHVLWTLLQEQREHLKAVAAECHRAGVEDFRAGIAAAEAELIAELLRSVVADPALRLTVEQRDLALTVAARRLRQIESGEDVNGGA